MHDSPSCLLELVLTGKGGEERRSGRVHSCANDNGVKRFLGSILQSDRPGLLGIVLADLLHLGVESDIVLQAKVLGKRLNVPLHGIAGGMRPFWAFGEAEVRELVELFGDLQTVKICARARKCVSPVLILSVSPVSLPGSRVIFAPQSPEIIRLFERDACDALVPKGSNCGQTRYSCANNTDTLRWWHPS